MTADLFHCYLVTEHEHGFARLEIFIPTILDLVTWPSICANPHNLSLRIDAALPRRSEGGSLVLVIVKFMVGIFVGFFITG